MTTAVLNERQVVTMKDLDAFTVEIRQGREFIKVTRGYTGLEKSQAIYQSLESLKQGVRSKQACLTTDQIEVYNKLREDWMNLNTSRN